MQLAPDLLYYTLIISTTLLSIISIDINISLWKSLNGFTTTQYYSFKVMMLVILYVSNQFEASCPDGLCPGWSIILKGETPAEASK